MHLTALIPDLRALPGVRMTPTAADIDRIAELTCLMARAKKARKDMALLSDLARSAVVVLEEAMEIELGLATHHGYIGTNWSGIDDIDLDGAAALFAELGDLVPKKADIALQALDSLKEAALVLRGNKRPAAAVDPQEDGGDLVLDDGETALDVAHGSAPVPGADQVAPAGGEIPAGPRLHTPEKEWGKTCA